MAPYSMDLRTRVVSAVQAGQSCHKAAARFGVSASTAIKWVRRSRETGSVAPDKIGGHKPRTLSGAHRDWLLGRTTSDFTLRGLVLELAGRGVKVDYVSVWRFVHAEGLSFKKKHISRRTTPPKSRTPKVIGRREQWKKYQGRLDPKRLVFIDETWAKTNMAAPSRLVCQRQTATCTCTLRTLEDDDLRRCATP